MGLLNYSKVYSKTIYIVLGFFFGSLFIKVDYMQPCWLITAILIPSREKGNLVGIATQATDF
jgi:hypothetical protein